MHGHMRTLCYSSRDDRSIDLITIDEKHMRSRSYGRGHIRRSLDRVHRARSFAIYRPELSNMQHAWPVRRSSILRPLAIVGYSNSFTSMLRMNRVRAQVHVLASLHRAHYMRAHTTRTYALAYVTKAIDIVCAAHIRSTSSSVHVHVRMHRSIGAINSHGLTRARDRSIN